MIDLIYVLAYVAITAMLAGAVIGAWKLKRDGEDEAMNLERRVTLVISVAFIASFVAVILFYLLPGAKL